MDQIRKSFRRGSSESLGSGGAASPTSASSNTANISSRPEYVMSSKFSDTVVRIANEPTVGLFYVQEHVHASVPGIVHTQEVLLTQARSMQTYVIDADLALQSVRSMINPAHFAPLFTASAGATDTDTATAEDNSSVKSLRVRVALLEHKLRDA